MKVKALKWRVNNDPLAYGLVCSAPTICDDVEIYDEEGIYAVLFQSFSDYDKDDCKTLEEAKAYAQKKHEIIVEKKLLQFLE